MTTLAICTWNRCELLRKTLAQIEGLAKPPGLTWELLVVDNGSTDATADVVRSFENRLPTKYVLEEKQGASFARNRALDEAAGDWIVFIDDDVLIEPAWFMSVLSAIERNAETAIVSGPIAPWFPVEPPADLLEVYPELAKGFCGVDYGGPERLIPPECLVFTANMAVHRSAAAGIRFNTNVGGRLPLGEDIDFVDRVRRAGGTVLWVPAMRVKHYVDPSRMTLEFLRRYRATAGAVHVRLGTWPPAPSLLGAPRWAWRAVIETYVKQAALQLRGNRIEHLKALRVHDFSRGMLSEFRRISAEAQTPSGPAAS